MLLPLIVLVSLSSAAVLGKPAEVPPRPTIELENSNFIVGIRVKLGEKFRSCGGVLLDSKRALTAASCFMNDNHKLNKKNVELLINSVHFSALDDPEIDPKAIKAYADKIVIHPEFDKKKEQNNLAIVYIKDGVKLPTQFQFAQLPSSAEGDYGDNTTCKTTSWGSFTADGKMKLLESEMETLEEDDCSDFLPEPHYDDPLLPSNVCAEHKGERTVTGLTDYSCQGFNGNPLYIGNKVIGIHSWVEEPKYCGAGISKVYSRLTSFVDWIESTKH